jgi:NADPH-dependent 7-cyano-7-deazaguanine reductase QueF
MEKDAVKLVVFNGEDFGYWKNQTSNYLLSQGRALWETIQIRYVILTTLENATQGELQRYKNNYKTLNLITTALSRNVYDHILHLETAHDVWLKLCNTYEGSFEIKSSRKDTYNRQYQTFSQKHGESLDDCFARFVSIVSNLRACGSLAYIDNEHAKQLLYALDNHVWGMKITALEKSADFATLDI